MRRCMEAAFLVLVWLTGPASAKAKANKNHAPVVSPLDRYIKEATAQSVTASRTTPAGSLWSGQAYFSDIAADLRASRVSDIVTVQVAERASAVSKGTVQTERASSTNNTIGALAGITRAAGPWQNLAKLSGDTKLNGQGTSTRDMVLTTTVAARVTHVLPNGNLVVEGSKNLTVNSENQVITLRGVVRPVDLSTGNVVSSDRLAMLDVQVNGKGIVADAVRRPNFLYRLLLGLLPF